MPAGSFRCVGGQGAVYKQASHLLPPHSCSHRGWSLHFSWLLSSHMFIIFQLSIWTGVRQTARGSTGRSLSGEPTKLSLCHRQGFRRPWFDDGRAAQRHSSSVGGSLALWPCAPVAHHQLRRPCTEGWLSSRASGRATWFMV